MRALAVAAVVLVCVVLAGGLAWGVQRQGARDRAERAARIAAFEKAQTICGSPPVALKHHGASWSLGPWIEVRCADGTVRAVMR